MNFEDMRAAYLRALAIDTKTYEELKEENEALKRENHALQEKNDRIVSLLQSTLDGVLRIAREGKSDT
jgi:cell division protein FtsB